MNLIKIPSDKRVLVVEDNNQRNIWFREHLNARTTICATKEAALEELKNGAPFDIVFLDHDAVPVFWSLEDAEVKTFYDVAKRLTELNFDGNVVIHSFNEAGAKRMMSLLRHTAADVVWMKFGTFGIINA